MMIICVWIANLPFLSGHNKFTNTKLTRPCTRILKSGLDVTYKSEMNSVLVTTSVLYLRFNLTQLHRYIVLLSDDLRSISHLHISVDSADQKVFLAHRWRASPTWSHRGWIYRASHVLGDLGWVDLDLGSSPAGGPLL